MKLFSLQHIKKHILMLNIFTITSLIFILSGCEDYTSENHIVNTNPINSVNTGFIVQSDDGTIYYQDGKNNNNITQLSEHGEIVFNDTYGMCLSIYDNYLYYRNFGDGAKLMRLEITDPDNREIISDINTLQTIIIDEMIYANIVDAESDKDGLYRMNLDGTKKKKLVGAGINCMQYESDYIYYAAQAKGQLFRIDLNGKNQEEILLKETGEYVETTHFIVDDGWIYFNNSNFDGNGSKSFDAVDSTLSICRISIDGTKFEELVTGFVLNIYSNSKEDYLIYSNEDNLYTMNLVTGEIKQILNEKIDWVNVIDDIVYAMDWGHENNDSVIYRIDIQNDDIKILGE